MFHRLYWIRVKTTMKIIILLLALTTTMADEKCKGVYFNEKYFELTILMEGVNRLQNLALNQNDHTVYFTFSLLKFPPTSTVGYVTVGTKEAGLIDGIKNARAVAVDQMNNVVYVGGENGLFKINEHKVPIRLSGVDDNIVSLFFKSDLFYTNTKREAFKYDRGESFLLNELQGSKVDSLIIDHDDNIFFTQDKNLFRVQVGTKAVNVHERYKIDFLTVNSEGKPFIGTSDGVYTYDRINFTLKKVSGLNNLKAMSFNKFNEPIYSVEDKIIKLNYKSVACHDK